MKGYVVGFVLMVCSMACSTMHYVHGVPNLIRVDTDPPTNRNLFRGGQPTSAGWQWLWDQGVRTVVKFDYEAEGSDTEAQARGMVLVYIPMHPAEVHNPFGDIAEDFMGPSNIQLMAAVQALREGLERGGVYGHCLHGQDRTGVVFAVFRLLVDHWTRSRANRELMMNGYHPELLGLADAWEDFAP